MAACKTFSPIQLQSSPSRGKALTSILLLFIALDIGLLFFGLSDAFDGFHGFQEAWYAAIAKNYSSHSLFMPTTYDDILDLNVPPLFSYLVGISFFLFGPSEAAARLVPTGSSLLALIGVFLLGRTLLREEAGLEAAALLASSPIFLILGRSVQTDMLFVSLSLLSMFFYLRARRGGRMSDNVLAGLFLGASLFSKQFAVLPLAAIVAWELLDRKQNRLLTRDFILFLLVAALVISPYYGYHLLHDPGRLLYAQLHGSASKAGLASGPTFGFLASEMLWACSPLLFVGSLVGLGLFLLRPNREKLLIGLAIASFIVFFLFFHRHSYYFFGMVPFLSLCFTELSVRMSKKAYTIILAATLLLASSLSAYMLAGCEYGRGELKKVGEYLRAYERPVVMADGSFYYNYAPLFRYYCENSALLLRGSELTPSEIETLNRSDGIFQLSDFPLDGSGARSFPVTGVRYGLRLGGRIYIHNPPNMHFFAPAPPSEIKDYDVIRSFGPVVKLEQTSFYLIAEPRI